MVTPLRHKMVSFLLRAIIFVVLAAVVSFQPLPAIAAGKLVAVVMTSDIMRYRDAHRAFVKTLAANGYDQNNLDIILQTPNPDPISWANSVRKVVGIGADIIITYGAPATQAAMRETEEIPIVFADVYGPVETGVTKNMTVTGRNMTGVSSKVPMITLLKALSQVKPMRKMGVIYNSRESGSVVQLKEIKRAAVNLGFEIFALNITSAAGLDLLLSPLLSKIDALYVSECSAGCKGFEKIIHRANDARVPVISQMPSSADRGALISLEISPEEQGQLAGESAVKVLNGKKINNIPIATPKKTDLIINLRSARNLDLHVPFQVLSIATRILK